VDGDKMVNIDLDRIKEILDLMEKRQLVEFEYEEEGKRIKLRKGEDRISIAPANTMIMPVSHTAHPPEARTDGRQQDQNTEQIKSPLVGTFYRSPKPGAPPFVNVGDEVAPDKVVCIIESMKVMNEIKAQTAGVIKEILVKDGQAVQYGDVLIVIEKK
jgi:acetyl-CoA carboxylase biotin carboxyl carrier protein